MTEPRPFGFDTDFSGDPLAAPPAPSLARRKRVYLAEEVDALRDEAMRQGEATAVALTESARATALAELAQAVRTGLTQLNAAVVEHKASAADLTLRCARLIAGGALERLPKAPLEAALEALAREFEGQARLVIRSGDPSLTQADVAAAAEAAGFPGQVALRPMPGAAAAFEIIWGDGEARFDPEAIAARIADAFASALAAEGLAPAPAPHHSPTGA